MTGRTRLVEAAGIEPASASPTLQVLRACPAYWSRSVLPGWRGKHEASFGAF